MRSIALPTLLGAAVTLFVYATPAQAQATRTWVSGVGDDVNPCSRTAPCKTFAGAISKTAVNGLINCIDPGGFGTLGITKSITIDCKNVQAGMLAAGTNGININTAGVVVTLRGLSIEGVVTGFIGINFIQGAVLNIEHSVIFGFASSTAQAVRIAPSAGAVHVTISDSSILLSGTGLDVEPTGGASAVVSLQRVKVASNGTGIVSNGAGGSSIVLLHESSVSSNTDGCSSVSGGVITSFTSNNFSGNVTTQCTPTNISPPQ